MTRLFPIRLDAEIKHVPWDFMEPHQARCIQNHGKPLEDVSMQGGLTPEEALAVLEDRPFERMSMTAATLALKQKVEEWQRDDAGFNIMPTLAQQYPRGTPFERQQQARGRALHALELAKSMRDGRRAVYKKNWNELITALEGLVEMTR